MQVAVVLAIRVVEEVLLIFLWKLHGSMYYSCITVRPVRQNPFYLSCSPLAPWPSFSRDCSLHIASFPPAVSGSFLCARARSFPALTLISQRDRRRGRRDPFRSCQILVCGFGPRGGGRIPARPGCEKVIRSVTLATRGKLNMCARTHERAKWRPTRVHSLAVGETA